MIEKQLLENNIQTALAQQLIDLDDAIDVREVRNVKLANQLLKIKRKKKQERDQKIQQQNKKPCYMVKQNLLKIL